MINILELPKTSKNIIAIGDIHGDFEGLRRLINQSIKKNSVIFVCGDCGFGFEKQAYYEQELKRLNNLLESRNSIIVFVRGNHDDPSYFFEEKLNFTRMKLVPDYTVVKVGKLNILCVGGGISIDRTWRKQEEANKNKYKSKTSKSRKKLYWEDEAPVFMEDFIHELKEKEISIDVVVTHTAPSYVNPKSVAMTALSWFRVDKNLRQDINNERETMDNIHKTLIADGHNIKAWVFGHFHLDSDTIYENKTYFRGLNCSFGNVDVKAMMHHIDSLNEPQEFQSVRYNFNFVDINANPFNFKINTNGAIHG